ncbi:MAG: nitrite/sulfite reductase [Parvibaculaceae bacterium]
MYRYDEFDQQLVNERVAQFRDQVTRRLAGELSEDEFKMSRLMNGVYLQLHSYMLRIAIPYGMLSSRQVRKLAEIERKYDKGYGHFTTRQNLQLHWPALKDIPDLLGELASVEMHCIQTSGNCIRNTTSDHHAGACPGELEDPRVICEVIRQWSTFHPEFSFLPRKFKIAVSATEHDRAAIRVHDIGIQIVKNAAGEIGYEVWAGGGLGRTPIIGKKVGDFVPREDLLAFLESVLRVYNMFGRRDNLYKSRIKILVHEIGTDEMRRQVEAEFAQVKAHGTLQLPEEEVARIRKYFASPEFETLSDDVPEIDAAAAKDKGFADWLKSNISAHRTPGYTIVNVSLKPVGLTPGDCSADQMDVIADIADKYAYSEVRVAHEQNLCLAHVRRKDLYDVYKALNTADLATPNIGLITDQIACPGLDYCNLANARSIAIATRLSERFQDIELQQKIGRLHMNMSGCINACGHHHVGHIGILGVDKKGVEYYQVTLGGAADETAAVGDIVGPAFTEGEIIDAVDTIVKIYLDLRQGDEIFIETYRRIGVQPFKDKLYAAH